jgi:hypothetical protein
MIADFSGMMPIRDPILLPDVNAQYAENAWLYEGAVRGFRQENPVYTILYSDTQRVYRVPISITNPPDFSSTGSVWLEFPDPYMSVIRNPTVGDIWDRYYFFPSDQYSKNVTGANPLWPTATPGPVYNPLQSIVAGSPWLSLGVPIPATAPTVTSAPSAVVLATNAVTPTGNGTLNFANTTGVTVGMNVTYLPGIISFTANAPTAPGNSVLGFANTAGIYTGMHVTDGSLYSVTLQTPASVAAGTNILYFNSTTSLVIGMEVADTTSTVTIYPGTKITAMTGTSVTISNNLLLAVAPNDSFKFSNNPFADGTTVTAVTATTVSLSLPLNDAGIWPSYTVNFQNTPIQPGSTVSSVTPTTVSMDLGTTNMVGAGEQIQFSATTLESRAYVYTMVSAYGEEGPPSVPTVSNGAETGTWTISIPQPPAGTNTNRDLVSYRLYRTVTDSSGAATYYQVNGDIPIDWNAAVTINDNALDQSITANQVLPSINYLPPPPGLQGVVMMANGIAAGFTNQREVWFSQPYLPHAWPAVFALTVDYPIVGLTADGTSLNILTEGAPFIATGTTPDTMTIGKMVSNESCIGRGSIVGSGEGAYYASPNGYVLVNSSNVINVTDQLFEKEFWNTLTPWNMASAKYGNSTIVVFIKGPGVASIDPNRTELIHGCVINFAQGSNVSFTYLDTFNPITSAYVDEVSGQIFYVTSGTSPQVFQWNAVPNTTTAPVITGNLWPWIWKTKKFRFTFPQQFKAFMVLFDVPSEITFTPGTRNVAQDQEFDQTTQYLIVRVFADGNQIVVREIQTSGETLLIPGGAKWTQLEFQFEGVIRMKFFKAATSVHELKVA